MKNHETKLSNQEIIHSLICENNQAKTLVFLHGNMGSSQHFEPLLKALKDRYNLHALDLRGFGDSSYHRPIKTIADLSHDVRLYLEAHQLKQVTFITHGTGMMVAFRLAIDYPRRTHKIIALAPCLISGLPIHQRRFLGLIKSNRYIHKLSSMQKHVAPMEKYKRKNQRWILKKLVTELFFNLEKPTEEAMNPFIDIIIKQRNLADFNFATSRFNIFFDDNGVVKGSDEAKFLTMPILLIHGKEDQIMPYQNTYLNKKYLPETTKSYILQNAGYFMFYDCTETTIKHIEDFISNEKADAT